MTELDQRRDSFSETDDSEHEDDFKQGENRFSLTEYDLDVVDDALLNPDSTEFHDHFGFRIEVKTDDEDSSDSDSDSIDSGYDNRKAGPAQNSSAAKVSAASSATTGSSEEDNESDGSVDTAMTTPTAHKHPNRLSASSVELQKAEVVTRNSASLTTVRRGRSATVSKVTPQPDAESLPPLPQEQQTRRRRATTVSRPSPSEVTKFCATKDENATTFSSTAPSSRTPPPPVAYQQQQYQGEGAAVSLDQQQQQHQHQHQHYQGVGGVPLSAAPSRASSNDQFDTVSLRSAGTSFEAQSRPDSSSGFSLASFSLFKRAGSPTSTRSTQQRVVERPSQAFRERQSKRMSEYYRMQSQTPSSPSPSLHQAGSRLSYASASSYYEMLMSKFGRTSEEIQYRETPKHTALKEEAKQVLQQLRETSDQYDWDFWYSFVQDNDLVSRSQPDEVKRQLTIGVPPALRGYIWQIVSKSRNAGELESEYRELLKRVCPYEKNIRRDLAKSFPVQEFFGELNGEGQEALFNVIKAYSLFDQQIGYSQGMFFIVGCLVLQMSDEQAFCVLVRLMSQYGFRNQFSTQMETLHGRLYQFDHIMQQKLPELHRHLEVQGVEPGLYATQWFMTVFAYKSSLNLVFRVLDVLFIDGPYAVLHFALALMHRNQHTMLAMEHDELVDFLNNGVFDSYQDDENAFVQDAYKIDIPTRLLARLAKQHASEAAREAKAHSQEEHLRRINADLSKHIRRLEKSYHSLKVEHQEVTQQVIEAKMNVARMDDDNQQLRRQLLQARSELEQLKRSLPNVEELTRQNKQLLQRNNDLESQLADIEAVLISLKVKYAERESAYEELKQKAQKAGIPLL